jgi:tripartite-type tricarboxylate transporter receptor subunit TctC
MTYRNSSTSTRRRLCSAAILGVALVGTAGVLAQPTGKPLRVIVAGAAGGGTDIIARLLADGLHKELRQTVFVDLKPGGGGAIAVNDLMQSPHDGSTMLVAISGLVSEVPHIVKLRIDMAKEVRPIAELARFGLVLVGNPSVPAKTMAELVAYVKANPGKVSYASYSPGTIAHLSGLKLNQAVGTDLTHVGYKSSQPALTDVMGGHVPLMFDGMSTSLPLIKAGKLKAFGVSLPQRAPALPEVPTFRELGLPDLEAVIWFGAWVTPDMPEQTQARLRQATLNVLEQPAVQQRLQELGFSVGLPRSPEELQRALKADFDKTGELLRSIDFKPE